MDWTQRDKRLVCLCACQRPVLRWRSASLDARDIEVLKSLDPLGFLSRVSSPQCRQRPTEAQLWSYAAQSSVERAREAHEWSIYSSDGGADEAQIPQTGREYDLYLVGSVHGFWASDWLVQICTCPLKPTFCLIITTRNAVVSRAPGTPFSSTRTEKNDRAQLGTRRTPLFSHKGEKPARSREGTKHMHFWGLLQWLEGGDTGGRTSIFPGKCGLFHSCHIPDGNPTERKLAFTQGFLWRCLCVQNERWG